MRHNLIQTAVRAWQIKAIEKSLAKANIGKAYFVEHDRVVAWLKNWGTEAEQKHHKCLTES